MTRRCVIATYSVEFCLTLSFSTNRATFVAILADNSEEGEVEQEETNPTIQQHPLRRADSEDQLRQQFEGGKKESSCT